MEMEQNGKLERRRAKCRISLAAKILNVRIRPGRSARLKKRKNHRHNPARSGNGDRDMRVAEISQG